MIVFKPVLINNVRTCTSKKNTQPKKPTFTWLGGKTKNKIKD